MPAVFSRRSSSSAGAASEIREPSERRAKAQAAGTYQRGAEHLGAVLVKRSRKPACDFLPAEQRAQERVGKWCVLVGGELALPGSVADAVGADRPEIRAAADELAVAQHDDATVAALHAVEHMNVNGIEPILHGSRRRPF